jgi:hypothetical protein
MTGQLNRFALTRAGIAQTMATAFGARRTFRAKETNASAGKENSMISKTFRIVRMIVLASFALSSAAWACTTGRAPFGLQIQASNGSFYGTTEFGGDAACSSGAGQSFNWSADLAIAPAFTPSSLTFAKQ